MACILRMQVRGHSLSRWPIIFLVEMRLAEERNVYSCSIAEGRGAHATHRFACKSQNQVGLWLSTQCPRLKSSAARDGTYARIADVVFSDSKGASGSFEGRSRRLWPIMSRRAMPVEARLDGVRR